MKKEPAHVLSDELMAGIADALKRKEQCLLFLNRRGFFTYIACKECGWEARCPKCGVSLVMHVGKEQRAKSKGEGETPHEFLKCHYCSTREPLPERCPQCKQETVKLKGKGTQRAASQIEMLFPGVRVLRWDRDTTRRRRAHQRAFESVKKDDVDVIVGTQMVAQGLDFPRVTVVGVLDADRPLRFPDFRAAERAFQLLTQVAGRARSAHGPGTVYVQTRHPDHHAIRTAQQFDYKSFAEQELRHRAETSYPPARRLARILLQGSRDEAVETAADQLTAWLENLTLGGVDILGPAPAARGRRAGRTQWQILIKAEERAMDAVLDRLRDAPPLKGVRRVVDVDPESME
jgi:primosomal protein N' (replication factor Y) (superfamily II helicase)